MKRNQENLDTFIAEQKARFNKYLKDDAGFDWNEDWRSSSQIRSGFFSCRALSIKKANRIRRIPEAADCGGMRKNTRLMMSSITS